MDAVLGKTGYKSTSTIYVKMAGGTFPRSVEIQDGSGTKRWIESDVDEWIEKQIAASRSEAVAP
jgi:predicted DNA-binding transcriptional regulator AlpA